MRRMQVNVKKKKAPDVKPTPGAPGERKVRRRELLFTKSVELAKANRDFIAMVADKTGQTAQISDYAVYAEMYCWLLTELDENGKLPENWRQEIQKKSGHI